ncbi:hypothetical protein [Streptomyces sp. NBC_01363]|uniref:hypothetical protein n=1 Tax=Streptomyces sp. NBC_01363 TaxID=2903840 RepID=UPI00225898BE|nr:hypothetical protein [Streptomyces sp. NBC_01363]MCX4734356.1 hypothetical protein [Streptomyces sp. NBC_01363]
MTDADAQQQNGAPPDGPTRLRVETEHLLEEARREVRNADRRVGFWTVVDIGLGFPTAVLAGVSGAAGLASADARVPAALLALVSAGLAAGSGFLRSDVKCAANRRSRRAWGEVEAKARLLLAQEPELDRVDGQEALRAIFQARQAALASRDASAELAGP